MSKPLKASALSAEAAAMEAKLAELRKAMEKERAKREALMANAGAGSIWRNGAAGGLRNAGKGPGAAATVSSSGASTNRRPDSSEASAPPSGSTSARGSSAIGSSSAAAAPAEIPTISGSRLTAPRPAAGPSSRAQILDLQSGTEVGGMSCGTEDEPSLAAGAFNEADSHRSFLEALNEWRRGSRGEGEAAAGSTNAASTSAAATGGGGVRASSAVEHSTLEVQTEQRPLAVAARPGSAAAKPLSYFDKLIINTTSRTAGQLAAGVPPEEVVSTVSIPRPVPRPTSASTLRDGADTASALASAVNGASSTSGAATAAKPSQAAVPAAPAVVIPPADPNNPFSILDRLEALERQRQAAAQADDDDDAAGSFTVTTATGVVLTKNMRLPDEVLLPDNNKE
ncbi:hypothetical protein HYH02_002745 [Chlamydomonas schloesseri]|uniref:Uncharacterized protein n=1 Tax=Chlamydomonas schloesseri TaxID=2026947 RepID=A0A835WTK1_9CHLO|nr:hypothetical protein HYH02_002745 [Chlamydomonas schloesseri]|eukprot:KAG2452506.1 hypothetical protein HYH02_002745 [Chlamydomonas schloesseri]